MVKMNIKVKRFIAFFLDVLAISYVVVIPDLVIEAFLWGGDGTFLIIFRNIVFSILFISKDSLLKGESIGKRICKLELLTITNEKPTFLVKILRNLTIYLWPIELVLLIVLNKRLGDIIFKTKVVEKI